MCLWISAPHFKTSPRFCPYTMTWLSKIERTKSHSFLIQIQPRKILLEKCYHGIFQIFLRSHQILLLRHRHNRLKWQMCQYRRLPFLDLWMRFRKLWPIWSPLYWDGFWRSRSSDLGWISPPRVVFCQVAGYRHEHHGWSFLYIVRAGYVCPLQIPADIPYMRAKESWCYEYYCFVQHRWRWSRCPLGIARY